MRDRWAASDAELRALITEYEGLLEPHLIVAGESARVGAEIPVYVDEPGLAHKRYGLRGAGLYLVRPDGYVAFRASGTDLRPLQAYLHRVFPSPSFERQETHSRSGASRQLGQRLRSTRRNAHQNRASPAIVLIVTGDPRSPGKEFRRWLSTRKRLPERPAASDGVQDIRRTTCCVVGGGPGGAVLALLLAAKGWT
jgi:hypothetical protein